MLYRNLKYMSAAAGMSEKKGKGVTSTNSIQVLKISNKMEGGGNNDAYYDANYEAKHKEKTLIEINKKRLNRKIQNLEREANRNLI